MFNNFNRGAIAFGIILVIGGALYFNQQKDTSEAPIGYSWYNDDLGYRLLLPDGWLADKTLNSVAEEVTFWPPDDSPYQANLGDTFLSILEETRSRDLYMSVMQDVQKDDPSITRTDTTVAGKPATCYTYPYSIISRKKCIVVASDKLTVVVTSDFLVIPEVQKMWGSLEFDF